MLLFSTHSNIIKYHILKGWTIGTKGKSFGKGKRFCAKILDYFEKMVYDNLQSLPDTVSVSGMAALVGEIAVPCTCNPL